jgi:hypothetical protein
MTTIFRLRGLGGSVAPTDESVRSFSLSGNPIHIEHPSAEPTWMRLLCRDVSALCRRHRKSGARSRGSATGTCSSSLREVEASPRPLRGAGYSGFFQPAAPWEGSLPRNVAGGGVRTMRNASLSLAVLQGFAPTWGKPKAVGYDRRADKSERKPHEEVPARRRRPGCLRGCGCCDHGVGHARHVERG